MYRYIEAKLYIITELLNRQKIHLNITPYDDIVKVTNLMLYDDM